MNQEQPEAELVKEEKKNLGKGLYVSDQHGTIPSVIVFTRN